MNLSSLYPLARSMLLLAKIWHAESDIYDAVREDRVDDVATYLNLTKADIDKTDEYGQTLLNIASSRSSHELVELLLKKGADSNKADNRGNTPLHLACEKRYCEGYHKTERIKREKIEQEKQVKIAILLLNNGAQVDAPNNKGHTPLHLAAYGGHKDLTKLLMQKEANINLADKKGITALHYALTYGKESEGVVEALLENNADVNKASYDGETPLAYSWCLAAAPAIKMLLEHGASIDVAYYNLYLRRRTTIRDELMNSQHHADDKHIFLAIIAKKKEKDLLEKKLRLEKEMKENAIKSEIKLRNSKRVVINRKKEKDIYYQCSKNQNNISLEPILSVRSPGLVKFLNNE
jgi:ankyrin repeat protein